MKLIPVAVVLLGLCCLLTYCQFENTPPEQQQVGPVKTSLYIFKGQELSLELALTEAAQTKGLMYHVPLKNNEGMLFVYPEAEHMNYWNPNVPFNIDLAYFDASGTIMSIHRLLADDETSIASPQKAQYVLEMREGWFAQKGIKVGDSWPRLLSEKWLDVE